jgi:hypothetical protein
MLTKFITHPATNSISKVDAIKVSRRLARGETSWLVNIAALVVKPTTAALPCEVVTFNAPR